MFISPSHSYNPDINWKICTAVFIICATMSRRIALTSRADNVFVTTSFRSGLLGPKQEKSAKLYDDVSKNERVQDEFTLLSTPVLVLESDNMAC